MSEIMNSEALQFAPPSVPTTHTVCPFCKNDLWVPDEAREALECLRELVACKNLKDKLDRMLREDAPNSQYDFPEESDYDFERRMLRAEYNRRKGPAWANARRVLGQGEKGRGK